MSAPTLHSPDLCAYEVERQSASKGEYRDRIRAMWTIAGHLARIADALEKFNEPEVIQTMTPEQRAIHDALVKKREECAS